METARYARKPFFVDAVRVSRENMEEVAKWCMGDILTSYLDNDPQTGQLYIRVHVHRALNERQTKAFIGDWVLYAGTGFKVYSAKAFNNSFEPVAKPVEAVPAVKEKDCSD